MHPQVTGRIRKRIIAAVASIGMIVGLQLWAPPSAHATSSGTVTITGAPLTGFLLTASPSGFTVAPSGYAWYAYSAASGGTGTLVGSGQTYTPVWADYGKYLQVEATTASDPVLSPRVGPIDVLQVTLSGEAKVGKTLTASMTGFSDDVTISWQTPGEMSSSTQIGTGKTYQIQEADRGKYIFALVTDNINVGRNRDSAQVGPVAGPDIVAGTPTIMGTPQVGRTLYVLSGSGWSPAPDSYTQQWLSDGEVITGAIDDYYVLTAAEVGHQISVRVTASKIDYSDATATSEKTTKVLAAPVAELTNPVAKAVSIGSGSCIAIPVSVGYVVPTKLATSLSSVKITARVTNSKGAAIGNVSMTSTAANVSGTAAGQFRWCSRNKLGKVTFSNLTGTWTGLRTITDASRPEPKPVSGVIATGSAAKTWVRAMVRFVKPTISAKGSVKSLDAKFQAYRPATARWSGVDAGSVVMVQKKVDGKWVTIASTKTADSGGRISLGWRAKKVASYRLVWAGSNTKRATVSAAFRG